jgi:Sulfotransferase domain
MQQICHQLRCGGDDDAMSALGEISEVVPYIEVAYDCRQDLDDDPQLFKGAEVPPFRAYKTHAWALHCPSFRRVIVVVRNPFDVVASFHRFFENWFFERGTVSLDDFAHCFWLARDVPENRMQNASYFVHLASWYERAMRQHDDDGVDGAENVEQSVLFVCFEDMVEDLEREVRRVANFVLPVGDDDESQLSQDAKDERRDRLIRVVTERSSFDYMRSHASKFDEHFTKLHRNAACGLPPPSPPRTTSESSGNGIGTIGAGGGSKIRLGRVGSSHSLLSDDVKRSIQQKWDEIVAPVTGCSTYEDLRRKLKTLQPTT